MVYWILGFVAYSVHISPTMIAIICDKFYTQSLWTYWTNCMIDTYMFKVEMVARVSFWVGVHVVKWIRCVKQTRAMTLACNYFTVHNPIWK
jgi:hypothetical protein